MVHQHEYFQLDVTHKNLVITNYNYSITEYMLHVNVYCVHVHVYMYLYYIYCCREEEAESDTNCGILAETGEAGLKEIVTVASLTHANAILHPVLW